MPKVKSQRPKVAFVLPTVAIELEAALEALDAPLHLGQVVRLGAARARGVLGVEVVGVGSGGGTWRWSRGRRSLGAHRPNTIRSSLRSATVARSIRLALTTQVIAAAKNASGPGA